MDQFQHLTCGSLRILLDETERLKARDGYRLISAKEKLKRVDPLSDEFEETADLIEKIH